ncbi:hypothetical protein MycrhDRAFT_6381 [Mycolicibacterium rhodesiae JS60]|nr:hypothetical protein MycrhDRAFT_6381 [Mycolicibacterium rhodesiae JS60]
MTVSAEPTRQRFPAPKSSPPVDTVGPERAPQRESGVTVACYVAALATLPVSLNTSWRFFDEVLNIPTADGERYIMFAVAELALVVSGAGMAVNVRRSGHPGPFRVVVWAMCAVSGYMAWAMSDLEEGLARVILGPVLGAVMLHLALGLELRARHHRTGTLARIGHELRERILSRLGLADDERDALQRTRDRAAFRSAQLSMPRRWRWSREARLQRALLAANVADDPQMRDKMLARLSVLHHAHELCTHRQPSPWLDGHPAPSGAPDHDPGPTPPKPPGSQSPQQARTTQIAHPRAPEGPAQMHARDASDPGQPSPAHSDPRTLAAVPSRTSAHQMRVPAHDSVDDTGIQKWLPLAKTLVHSGVTQGRMKRHPTTKHPEVVAAMLAQHDTGTPPSTIGRYHKVHHTIVDEILDAAQTATRSAG